MLKYYSHKIHKDDQIWATKEIPNKLKNMSVTSMIIDRDYLMANCNKFVAEDFIIFQHRGDIYYEDLNVAHAQST